MSAYTEKLRSLGFGVRRGTSERKPVINEENGEPAGYHVEHWDDHVDAVIQPKPVRFRRRPHDEG